jgi:signal transduction histidine kinase
MIEAGAADAVRQGTIIKEQTQRIVRIVRQLLDFARAERPVADDIDLRELASVAIEFLAPIGHEKAVTLTLDVGGAVFAHADGMQIRQVLTNLIVNGIQASPRGSSVVVSAGRVKETHQVSLDVTDSGPGVSDEVRGRLFQPFFTTKPPGEGTGLGLAVAWGIIRENGGTIVVEPAVVGEGAHFRILLPAATGSPASNDTPEEHDTHETHGEAVL